jgi:CheY-like chemotaxis protein
MPRGGVLFVQAANVKLKGTARLPVTNERCVRISIRDTGVGIPPDILPKIFDPYFTTKEKGTGLGLSTAYSIIRKHDGFITAKSDVGIGTTFTIYLPVSSRYPEIKIPPKPSTLVGRGRVLLMDDQDLIRDLACELLTDLGYEVCAVKDGAEAIEVYREAQETGKHFEVVVMDLTVPGGMGGQEAILKLRQIDPNVRAIASSGYSNDPVMAEYHKYGFVGVLPKPFTLDELIGALNAVTRAQEATG